MAMGMGSFASRVVATAVVATDGTGDFTDIQAAIDSLPADGGVVYIKEGTYQISVGITFPNDNISLIGAGASTIIQKTANLLSIQITKAGIILNNLNIDGNSKDGNCIQISGSGALRTMISQCYIHNDISIGISCSTNSGGIVITSNFIYSNGDHGIFLNNSAQIMISSNYIYNNTKNGIKSSEPV